MGNISIEEADKSVKSIQRLIEIDDKLISYSEQKTISEYEKQTKEALKRERMALVDWFESIS